jgi:hypothetical protein
MSQRASLCLRMRQLSTILKEPIAAEGGLFFAEGFHMAIFKRTFSVILACLLVPWFSFAEGRGAIYSKVVEDCTPLKSDSDFIKFIMIQYSNPTNYEIYWKSTKEMFLAQALNAKAFADLVDNRGMSLALAQMIESPEYKEALQTCFPNDDYFQRLYTMRLMYSDVQGKLTATAGTYYVGKLMTVGAKALENASVAAYRVAIGAYATWSTYSSYLIIKELSKDRTPEQQAEIDKFIKENSETPERIIAEARQLVKEEITRLQAESKKPGLSKDQKSQIQQKLNRLQQDLMSIS